MISILNFSQRWDFDTAEDYADYMQQREAMPKAAFQYGVKMSEGRKTRGKAKKDERAQKLERDLQKINSIIAKRKQEAPEGRKAHFRSEPDYKRHRT